MRRSLTALASILAFATASSTASAAAPEVAEIIGRTWAGVSVAPADWTQSGKVYIAERMHMSVDSSDDISGWADATFTLDGTTYKAHYSVRGHYDGKDGISLHSSLDRGDALPGSMHWCSASGDLTIYQNADKAGHYILRGKLSDDCGGQSDIEYTDE